MLRFYPVAGLAVLLLGGCVAPRGGERPAAPAEAAVSAAAQVSAAAAAVEEKTPTGREAYVRMAASSDLFEIQSSQLALSRSQSRAVREFAAMMIRGHTQLSNQLMSAARASGVTVSPALMPMHSEMLAQLQAASGAAFDAEYRRQQLAAHEAALALHANYAARGDTPALRKVATAAAPRISQHLALIRQQTR